jgi:hypothetical protein
VSDSTIRTYRAGAAADLRASAGLIVGAGAKAGGKARVDIITASSAQAVGVVVRAEPEPTVGQSVSVCVEGVCSVVVGATFTAGTTLPYFKAGTGGKAVPAAAGDYFIGYLLLDDNTDLADGDVTQCVISRGQLNA